MNRRNSRSLFAGLGVIVVLVIALVGAVAAVLNLRCQAYFRANLLIYPDAEMVSEESAFLGRQQVIFYTPAALNVVETWYTSEQARQMRAMVSSGDFQTVPAESWNITPSPDRPGSLIEFSRTCP
jgi:hypothetical protein